MNLYLLEESNQSRTTTVSKLVMATAVHPAAGKLSIEGGTQCYYCDIKDSELLVGCSCGMPVHVRCVAKAAGAELSDETQWYCCNVCGEPYTGLLQIELASTFAELYGSRIANDYIVQQDTSERHKAKMISIAATSGRERKANPTQVEKEIHLDTCVICLDALYSSSDHFRPSLPPTAVALAYKRADPNGIETCTRCRARFHRTCFQKWTTLNPTCPMCRRETIVSLEYKCTVSYTCTGVPR